MPVQRIAILGTGLIGGSFGLAVSEQYPEIPYVGFDRPEVLERAMERGAIGEAAPDIETAVRGADLVFVALPIVAAIEALPRIAAAAAPNALVTDAGSTKAAICRAAQGLFRNGARFLGGHPMAGRESSGIEHADPNLFQNSPYVLIANEDYSDSRVQYFAALLRRIGARPVWCDADTHDWAVGIVSHLPQMLALALARVVRDETDETGQPLTLSGDGLQDSLRLAGSPYDIWRDICLTNTDNISRALDRLAQAVDYLRTRLTSKELESEFRAANELYRQLKRQE